LLTRICGAVEYPAESPASDEASHLGAAGGIVRRDSLDLHIRLANGETVVLRDDIVPESDAGTTYTYHGFEPALHAHIVEVVSSLHVDYLLVDAVTGRETIVDGPPRLAPDGRRFATVAAGDPEAPEEPNRLAIYSVTDSGPEPQWATEPTDWQPLDAAWISESRLGVCYRHLPDTLPPSPDYSRGAAGDTLVETPHRWALVRPIK
jgi:hypothetical protein